MGTSDPVQTSEIVLCLVRRGVYCRRDERDLRNERSVSRRLRISSHHKQLTIEQRIQCSRGPTTGPLRERRSDVEQLSREDLAVDNECVGVLQRLQDVERLLRCHFDALCRCTFVGCAATAQLVQLDAALRSYETYDGSTDQDVGLLGAWGGDARVAAAEELVQRAEELITRRRVGAASTGVA